MGSSWITSRIAAVRVETGEVIKVITIFRPFFPRRAQEQKKEEDEYKKKNPSNVDISEEEKNPRAQPHIISRRVESSRVEPEPVTGRLFHPVAATDDISAEEQYRAYIVCPTTTRRRSLNPQEGAGEMRG